jgi:hypothetical protein
MKRKLGIILLVALTIEAVNFPAGAGYALDPGSSTVDPWYMQLLGFEWGALHASGLFVLDVLERGTASPSQAALQALAQGSPHTVFMVPVRPPESRPDSFLHRHRTVKLPPWGVLAVLIGGGYLSTVLLLFAVVSSFGRFLQWKRKHSAGADGKFQRSILGRISLDRSVREVNIQHSAAVAPLPLGETRTSRLLLGLVAMLGTWLISCGGLLLVRLTFQPTLRTLWLDIQAGFVAVSTYFLFVMPVTALIPKDLQLRFAYFLVILSFGWSTLAFHAVFRRWPWMVLSEQPAGPFMLTWFGGFTLCAVGTYLLLLWRNAKVVDSPC